MIFNQPKAAAGVSKDTLADKQDGEAQEVLDLLSQSRNLTKRQRWYLAESIANEIGYELTEETDEESAPSSDQCVAREALQGLYNEVAGMWSAFEPALRQDISHTNYNCVQLRLDAAKAALAVPQAAVADAGVVREALTLCRDAVMESFDYVSDKADQDIADMRLRSIDAALALTNPTELKS